MEKINWGCVIMTKKELQKDFGWIFFKTLLLFIAIGIMFESQGNWFCIFGFAILFCYVGLERFT